MGIFAFLSYQLTKIGLLSKKKCFNFVVFHAVSASNGQKCYLATSYDKIARHLLFIITTKNK